MPTRAARPFPRARAAAAPMRRARAMAHEDEELAEPFEEDEDDEEEDGGAPELLEDGPEQPAPRVEARRARAHPRRRSARVAR